MLLKRYVYILSLLILTSGIGWTQEHIEAQYDELTQQWLELSEVLKLYEGLSAFCHDEEFREYATTILEKIHHCDSVMLDFLNDPSTALVIGQKYIMLP